MIMTQLPFISQKLPGVGGVLKLTPEHFVVEEIPLYEPSGEGSHLYITLRRSGQTTREVAGELASYFGLTVDNVGYAGLKDKDAVTTQTFSLPIELSEAQVRDKISNDTWEILAIKSHVNKLKVGHLLGNSFTITLANPTGSLADGQAICEMLKIHGVPNYFGEQRFGRGGDNHQAGLDLLKSGRRGKGWRDKFLLSAFQSFIYNRYLAARIEGGLFEAILTGDICKKYATGGLFVSEDGAVETERLMAKELSATGPIFGAKMKAPQGPAADFESNILAELGLTRAEVDRAGVGDRRLNRLLIPELTFEDSPTFKGEFILKFALPKGAYATSVMREFCRGADALQFV